MGERRTADDGAMPRRGDIARRHVFRGRAGELLAWWVVLAAAVAALTIVAGQRASLPGDVGIARAVQTLDRLPFDALFGVLNVLGRMTPSLIFAAVVATLFVAGRRLDLALTYLAACAPRLLVNPLKELVDRPRPSADLVRVLEQSTEASFPSGHVVNAVLFYGSLIVLVEATALPVGMRRVVQALCLAVVLLMGPARVYAGAHWPSDALGGYLWGLLLLTTVLCGARLVRRTVPSGGA